MNTNINYGISKNEKYTDDAVYNNCKDQQQFDSMNLKQNTTRTKWICSFLTLSQKLRNKFKLF